MSNNFPDHLMANLNLSESTGRPRPRPAARYSEGTSRRPFIARFDSEAACGHDVYEGDEIAYVDDEIYCKDCWAEATAD